MRKRLLIFFCLFVPRFLVLPVNVTFIDIFIHNKNKNKKRSSLIQSSPHVVICSLLIAINKGHSNYTFESIASKNMMR